MTPEGRPASARRVLYSAAAALFILVIALGGWFLTRRVTPGEFILRVAPTRQGSRNFQLSLRGPGGGVLGLWGFQDVPTSAVLAGVQQKVPWKAVSTKASAAQPCVTLEVAPGVPESALAPLQRLLLAQCCPGVSELAGCPIRLVPSR